jgi:hypothetical protein
MPREVLSNAFSDRLLINILGEAGHGAKDRASGHAPPEGQRASPGSEKRIKHTLNPPGQLSLPGSTGVCREELTTGEWRSCLEP